MDGIVRASLNRGKDLFGRIYRRRWLRRTIYVVVALFIIYSLFGFFGVPYLLRRTLTGRVAASIHRPISAGRIAFNPYKLRLDVDRFHIADRDPQLPFVDLEHLRVQVSWASLFHLAPIVSELTLVRPEIHTIRTAPQTFNFSDLITRPAAQPPPPPSKPARFAVYNIDVYEGAVYLDDRVLSQHHQADQIRLGVPFIANLPSKVSIFVQPLLQMRIDGSPFRLDGRTKPFEKTQETVVDLSLHRLDLPSYFAYLPMRPPVQLRSGLLSTLLHLHFINTDGQPHIDIDGGAALDAIDLRDSSGAALVALNHATVALDQLEPLENEIHIKRIYVDGLTTYLVRNADGTTNLTPLTTFQPPPQAQSQNAPGPAAAATPSISTAPTPTPAVTPSPAITPVPSASATPTATPTATITPASPSSSATPATPLNAQAQLAAPAATATPAASAPAAKPALNLTLDSFEIVNSAVHVDDRSHPAAPATLALTSIHTKLSDFKLPAQAPAPFDFGANLSSGGAIAAKGNLALANHQAQVEAELNQLDLAALKAFAAPYLNGELQSGKLDAQAKVTADFAPGRFNVDVQPATAAISNFALKSSDSTEEPLAWDKFSATLAQFDLASHTAIVSQVNSDGLRVFGRRDRNGQLNLLALLKGHETATTPAPRPAVKHAARRVYHHVKVEQKPKQAPPAPPASQWHYKIAAVTIDKAAITGVDERGAKPVKLALAPLNLSLKDISDNLAKPIAIALDAIINGKGSLKMSGDAAPAPLDAKLKIDAKRVDLTAVNAYLGDQVNARLAAAFLTMDGTAAATNQREHLRASYRGDLTLGGVRVLDKVTGENFTRWNSFSARRIDAEYGGRVPKVHIGGVALSDFYARLILNRDGRLNIKDITSNPRERPRSLTRPEEQAAASSAPPTPAASTAPSPPKPLPADIAIGGVTLSGGQINWTDNFVKPNYSADLTQIGGKIGGFSTSSTQPADVVLKGLVNGSAPLDISGAVNPLAPMASLDITAKADGIELPGVSPYSIKYIGYPIIKGTLTVDVHYILQNQNLTAQNHIFIDQLTFGDKAASKAVINLPVRLAVAVLKDPSGAIKLDIPVSGSLNDPQFSIGAVVWGVLKNLIIRAATAPFNLIASAFGGNKSGQPLNYVEFAPGYAQLTPDDDKRLDVVAKALAARPTLKLDISGRVDPKVDREGLRFSKVDDAVKAQWLKSKGGAESGAAEVPKGDYDKYLKKAYKAAKFDKPTNAIGLTKSVPPDEMKKLMAAHETVSDEDLQHLAERRAGAVRAALVQRKIDPARLFIVAPKLTAEGATSPGQATGADLSIS